MKHVSYFFTKIRVLIVKKGLSDGLRRGPGRKQHCIYQFKSTEKPSLYKDLYVGKSTNVCYTEKKIRRNRYEKIQQLIAENNDERSED